MNLLWNNFKKLTTSIVLFYQITINPSIVYSFSFIDYVIDTYVSSYLLTWNTFNHSDAYWFLFNTKKVINEVKHLL